jgi:GTPase SAR1 family protein
MEKRLASESFNKKTINKTAIILGDSKVGKTSFIKRYIENSFKDSYNETIGINIYK